MASGDMNSGPHADLASALPTEPSFQLDTRDFTEVIKGFIPRSCVQWAEAPEAKSTACVCSQWRHQSVPPLLLPLFQLSLLLHHFRRGLLGHQAGSGSALQGSDGNLTTSWQPWVPQAACKRSLLCPTGGCPSKDMFPVFRSEEKTEGK